jgi:NADPH2:quinone reductase
MSVTMRALTIENGRLAVVKAPEPQAKPGELLVDVLFSAINSTDVQVRDGGWKHQAGGHRRRGPALTGIELGGVARMDGKRIRAGQRVIGYSHVLSGPRTHAEVVAMEERDLQVVPDELELEHAVALIVGGLAAIDVLERMRPLGAGERCLVAGAAGGVGAAAVQIARQQGAEVHAIASPEHASWLHTLGVTDVRDPTRDGWWRAGDAFDLVVDGPGLSRFAEAAPRLAPRGTYVSTNPQRDLFGFARAAFSSKRAGWLLLLRSNPTGLGRLLDLAVAGTLQPVIDSVYDLDEATAGFEHVAKRGKRGRVLLRVGALH